MHDGTSEGQSDSDVRVLGAGESIITGDVNSNELAEITFVSVQTTEAGPRVQLSIAALSSMVVKRVVKTTQTDSPNT